MAAPAPTGAPRPSHPHPSPLPNYNPNLPITPEPSLSQNFQNLQINQPPNAFTSPSSLVGPIRPPSSGQVPPFPASGTTPIGNFPSRSPINRPGVPPPGVIPRAVMTPFGPPQNAVPPNATPARPSTGSVAGHPPSFAPRPSPPASTPLGGIGGPPLRSPPPTFPASQVMHAPSSARPSGLGSPPFSATGPVPPAYAAAGPVGNGTPGLSGGKFPGALPGAVPGTFPTNFPLSGGVRPSQDEPLGPPSTTAAGPFSQAPPAHAFPGTVSASYPGNTPPSLSSQPTPPFSSGSSFLPSGSRFGLQPWQVQPHQVDLQAGADAGQPPRVLGMPPPLPSQGIAGMAPGIGQAGASMPAPSKIDPNQIPRPIPSASVILHETRQGNQANPPPPATSEYIVKDTGNCSPRYMRCTINQIPCTADLLATSGMQLALLVQPLALPHPSEEPIQIVDFGEGGPIRCSRCKGYINPFMKFIDQGRRFICNLCGFADETPHDYHCNLGPDGRRRDADERPELSRGTVEFIASKEYMVRDPMPAVFFFLIDVSSKAIQTGATAAACSAISQVIADLPEGPRTMVGIATFDSTIHFYNLNRALQQPLMLIVPDVLDVYTPLESEVIVQLFECRPHLELLLENIPTMFQSNTTADSAFGAATKAAFLAMKSTGGKLLVFQSVLPSIGIGALSARDAEGRSNVSTGEKEAHKLLQPADKTLKEMAIEFAEHQVCVDVFISSQSYVDIASISVVPRTTGGQVYYYYPFSAVSDTAKLYNDLRWNVTRPQGFEAVMRVRCSQGVQVQEYSGNFCKRIPTDVDLPGIDCDKTIMVTLKHDDKLQDGSECTFQCALLYTNVYGQRRIRVTTLSLPCTNTLGVLFRSADLDTQFTCFLKQAAIDIPTTPLLQVREQVTNHCVNILHSYRKFCASVTSSGQLILPESLKLLPLYALALIKSTGLRTDGRIDDRSFWIDYVSSLSATLAVPLVYPRMISVHDLMSKETEGSLIPSAIPLSSEHVKDEGIYLLENGIDAFVYIGSSVDPHVLQQLFGTSSVEEIPGQFVLQQLNNPLSKKFNEVINEIRRQRCSYLRLRLCKKGDPSGMLFFSYMVEEKSPTGLSYVEFLVHVHRHIQSKMT
ncbi:Protein transport protein Sec24C [Dionaea muscipula]